MAIDNGKDDNGHVTTCGKTRLFDCEAVKGGTSLLQKVYEQARKLLDTYLERKYKCRIRYSAAEQPM